MLALLNAEEKYAYQIAQSLTEPEGLTVSEGTIYPLLSRMQREGLIRSAWKESPAGPPRKYYALTAKGRPMQFVTLEDETGQINVVVWRDLAERQRRELLGARLLAVYGVLERQGEVAHLIAGRLRDLTPLLGDLVTQSRDFH